MFGNVTIFNHHLFNNITNIKNYFAPIKSLDECSMQKFEVCKILLMFLK